MFKKTSWIFGFLALALVGDRLVGFVFKKITENSKFRYAQLYSSNTAADVVFVGNSRGLSFYQPEAERILQKNTVNLSYNGMPADLAKCLVLDYLDRHPAPKLLVVDVTLCDRENNALKTNFNLFTDKSARLDTLLKGITEKDDNYAGKKVVYGGKLSWLYRHNSEVFQRVLFYRSRSDKDWTNDRLISDAQMSDTSFSTYQVRPFPNMVEHLKQLVDSAKARGIEVQLVIAPYYAPFAAVVRDSFLSPLKMQVEAATGLPVHDFSEALTDRSEIADYQHPNTKGSIHFINLLLERGIFNTIIGISSNNGMSENTNFAPPSVPTPQPEPTQVQPPQNYNVQPSQNTTPTTQPKKRRPRTGSDYGFSVDTMFSK